MKTTLSWKLVGISTVQAIKQILIIALSILAIDYFSDNKDKLYIIKHNVDNSTVTYKTHEYYTLDNGSISFENISDNKTYVINGNYLISEE